MNERSRSPLDCSALAALAARRNGPNGIEWPAPAIPGERAFRVRKGGMLALHLFGIGERMRQFLRVVTSGYAGTPHRYPPTHCRPFVHENGSHKSLHFSPSEVQSRMLKRAPHALQPDYTRTMMGFLAIQGRPRAIAMVGLGGGSLAKFCYRELPDARIDVVESNPHVLALRAEFHVPPDDDRFHVHLDDGARFIRRTPLRYDVLLLDAYTREGIPPQLTTRSFYEGCRNVLHDGGILVSNLYCDDAGEQVARIRRSFGDLVFTVEDADGENLVVFACANDGSSPSVTTTLDHIHPAARTMLEPSLSRVVAALGTQRLAATARARVP